MADDVIDLTADSDSAPSPPRRRGGFLVEDDDGVIDLTRSDSDVDADADDDVAAGEPLLSVAEVLRRVEERGRLADRAKRPRSPEPAAPPAAPPPPLRVAPPQQLHLPRQRARGDAAGFDFEAEVTGLQLWRPVPASHALDSLTHTFDNAATYTAAFSAPLLEEARESIRHSWASECANAAAGRSVRGVIEVRLVSVQLPRGGEQAGGWFTCLVEAKGGGPLPRLQDGSVAILSAAAPGASPLDVLRQAERGARHTPPEPPPLLHFAGFLQCEHDSGAGIGGYRPPPRLRFFLPKDEDDDAVWPLFRGSDVVARLQASLAAAPSAALTWHLAVVGRLASSSAECRALRAVGALPAPLLAALLRPMPPGHAPPGNGVAAPPDYAALPPPPLPHALAETFSAHLARGFNGEQRAAIHWVAAAGHGAIFGVGGGGGVFAQLRGDEPPPPRWPFTLVQGPPGTGKSHTLWGMLNALHVLGTHREAQQLAMALSRHEGAGAAAASYDFGNDVDYDEYDEYDGYDPDDAYFAQRSRRRQGGGRQPPEDLFGIITRCKPHILVCAPSNAAVDVLVARVLQKPFVSVGDGGERESYTPRVARLASEGTDTHAGIAAADCGKRIDALMAQASAARGARAEELSSKVLALTNEVQGLRAATLSTTSEPVRCAALAAACVRLRRCTSELRRLQLVFSRPGRSAREQLELSFLDDADIVFTTLGSAGRSVLRKCARPFDVVLIDEAAQATETAALLALQHLRSSAAAAVLVGDPAQLPATVLSGAARGAAYERSLFERLASCGVPSLLLTRQYRMHAEIAEFPSAYFYGSRLLTDGSVLARPAVAYEAAGPLAPFVFFDAHQGSERRTPGSSSTHNGAEAELAVQLYRRLAALTSATLVSLAPRVGIVTPYKGQCEELKRVFQQSFGQAVLDALVAAKSINTVDGFQGAEREVIIFSLVRTRSGGGGSTRAQLGHVDDVRRMNVGLTRAQRALWVVGHAQALRASPHWGRLLQHARDCGRLVKHPSKQTSLLDNRSSA